MTPRPLAQIIDNFLNGNGDDLIAIQGTYLLVIDFDALQKAVTVAIGNPLGCGPMRDHLWRAGCTNCRACFQKESSACRKAARAWIEHASC